MVFMQPAVKVNGAHYCDVLLLKQLLQDICQNQAAGDFCFPAHHTCMSKSTELLRHKTPDFTPDVASHRPDLSPVDYRLLMSHSGMRLPETARDVKHR